MRIASRIILLFAFAAGLSLSGCNCLEPGTRKPAEKTKPIALGQISFFDLEGKSVRLSEIANGKPIYLSFFASWCRSCALEVRDVNRIFNDYRSQGLLVYGVNVGDSVKNVRQFMKKHEIDYPVIHDPAGKTSTEKFELMSLPLNVVIDGTGNILYRHVAPPSDGVLKMAIGQGK
jgi:peroxiredoxin